MVERSIKIPGPDHPITIETNSNHVVIKYDSEVIADTHNSLRLREAKYPEVLYIPRADTNMDRLTTSEHSTYCPFKGDCSYFSLPGGAERALNAIWSYEAPFEAVSLIKDHLGFYPDRVDISDIQ